MTVTNLTEIMSRANLTSKMCTITVYNSSCSPWEIILYSYMLFILIAIAIFTTFSIKREKDPTEVMADNHYSVTRAIDSVEDCAEEKSPKVRFNI